MATRLLAFAPMTIRHIDEFITVVVMKFNVAEVVAHFWYARLVERRDGKRWRPRHVEMHVLLPGMRDNRYQQNSLPTLLGAEEMQLPDQERS